MKRFYMVLAAALAVLAGAWSAGVFTTPAAASAGPTPAGLTTSTPADNQGQRHAPAPVRYVALGDSYTAAPLVPTTDPAGGCYRSSNNYPHLVASSLNPTSFTDVSCSGATTNDAFIPQRSGLAAQIDAITADTTLVTIGLGGNDEGLFTNLLTTCATLAFFDPAGQPCTDYFTSLGTDNPKNITARTTERVRAVVQAVSAKAPQARILVVGYPVLVPRSGTCENLPMATGDYPYMRQVNESLSKALKSGAHRGGAHFIDVAKASRGHDICSSDPWINGPLDDPQRASAFHPFASEQRAVADMILREVRH